MKGYKLIAILMAMTITLTSCVSRGDENHDSSDSEEISSSSSQETSLEENNDIEAATSSSDIPVDEEKEEENDEETTDDDKPDEEKPGEENDDVIIEDELPPPNLEEIRGLSAEAIPWGPGVRKDQDGRSEACVMLQEKYGYFDAQFIAPKEKKIYLTFDEGYENGNTSNILDVLKEKNVKAVFFVTLEYVKANPDLVKRMIDEGHIVGNHSAGHPNYTKISLEQAMEATMKLHKYMLDNYNYKMTLFRYPEGAFSEQTAALLQSLGYKQVFWSFAYADWDPKNQMEPNAAYEKVKGATHDGAIYLLHAVSSTNTNILGKLIDAWRSEGYEIPLYDVDYEVDKVPDVPVDLG